MNTLVYSRFSELDIELFKAGKHFRLYEKLGSHLVEHEGKPGVYFAVWAPNAEEVSVIGDHNTWSPGAHSLFPRWDHSGIWEGFIPNMKKGDLYKYHIRSQVDGQELEKGDPFAKYWEIPPRTASVVWDHSYDWQDSQWMQKRGEHNSLDKPISVYEVHIGSWRRKWEEANRSLSYAEMEEELVGYVKEMGFTHVELMPVMEHPFFGSWGYQGTGYFAPTSRFGTPQDFMSLVDAFHREGIGVYLDWVPSHFPNDAHGLYKFDGSHLYEHADPRQGYHPDWSSYIFNYGRKEVRSFLISNAVYWLDRFHADGLRVDAVASMLYLDYSRKEGEWIPNAFGGRENLDAISLLQEMNEEVYRSFPTVQTIAEESTSWPMVSKPTFLGGLGFGMKWMMGWMNDSLEYFKKPPIHRSHHQNNITFSLTYAFSENFMLPLSHDEVVHGKGSLYDRMPGDEWQKFANLRLLYAYMFTHPGTKLLFMGDEIGQMEEWKHDQTLTWGVESREFNQGIQRLIKELNALYRSQPALFELQFSEAGWEWIDYKDAENSVMAYIRKGSQPGEELVVVCNFTPVPREQYRIGMPTAGPYREILNTDSPIFAGSGVKNSTEIETEAIPFHGRPQSLSLSLPPLGVLVLKKD